WPSKQHHYPVDDAFQDRLLSQQSYHSGLVEIRPGNINLPLYIFHAADGGFDSYLDIAKHLRPSIRLLGLPVIAYENSELTSIQQIASSYVGTIRRVHCGSVYRLMGWSLGALIAYEVGRQLAEIGETVDYIITIDPHIFCGAKSVKRVSQQAIVARFIQNIV